MSDHGLRIMDVINSIRKHKNVVVFITVATAIAGAVFYLAGPKRYEGKTEFILRNPSYGDRNFIYNSESKFIDYFANEDDIDRLIIMAQSGTVETRVISNMHLAEAYGIDASNRKGEQQVERKFSKNFNITRTEFKSLVLTYVDTDPERAAKVTNECVKVLETSFGDYFKEMRRSMYESVLDKIQQEDSTLNTLTDTMVAMRDRYGIFDIVNPARYNLMMSAPLKSTGNKNYTRGLELIQNLESLKDQVVTDRARQLSLVNQYKTGLKEDQLPLLKVVTVAKNPVSPKGIGGMYTVLACALIGFFFSTVLMMFADSVKAGRN
jgi:hypothetical protein